MGGSPRKFCVDTNGKMMALEFFLCSRKSPAGKKGSVKWLNQHFFSANDRLLAKKCFQPKISIFLEVLFGPNSLSSSFFLVNRRKRRRSANKAAAPSCKVRFFLLFYKLATNLKEKLCLVAGNDVCSRLSKSAIIIMNENFRLDLVTFPL